MRVAANLSRREKRVEVIDGTRRVKGQYKAQGQPLFNKEQRVVRKYRRGRWQETRAEGKVCTEVSRISEETASRRGGCLAPPSFFLLAFSFFLPFAAGCLLRHQTILCSGGLIGEERE